MNRKRIVSLISVLGLLVYFCYPSVSFAAESAYQDPFDYSEDGTPGSSYPMNWTNYFSNRNDKQSVKNFNFSVPQNGGTDVVTGATLPKTSQILRSSSFEGGYHEYRDDNRKSSVYTKKIVKPTQNPNVFDVQLDVIGGKKETKEKIDVAFVFDKSGSMNFGINKNIDRYGRVSYSGPSRWAVLNDSFDYFTSSFLENPNYDVNFALSSFSSTPELDRRGRPTGKHLPILDFAQYRDGTYFTNNQSLMTTHPILRNSPDGGTPTFLGVEAGMELLTNQRYQSRPDANKFIIFITDGSPSFDLVNNWNQRFNGIGDMNLTAQQVGGLHQYELSNKAKFEGTGVEGSTRYLNLNGFTESKYNQDPKIKKYAIGIGDQVDSYSDVLETVGPNGPYKVKDNVEAELNQVMMEIQSQIKDSVSSISNGTIVDEMSEYVTLNPDSVKNYQLKLSNNNLVSTAVSSGAVDDYAKKAQIDTSNNQVRVSNLSLAGDQYTSNGYRVTYQVELKPQYRDGHFYPANKPTYIVDANNPEGIGFAVPSIKSNSRDIPVEKVWLGDEAQKPDITFSLLANGKKVDELTLKDPQREASFKARPVLDEAGKTIDYKIEETIHYRETPPNYQYETIIEGDAFNGFKVTNTPKGAFKATKKASKTDLKPGQTFSYEINVTNTVKDSLIKEIDVSDTMPEGIDIVGNLRLNDKPAGTIKGNSFSLKIPNLKGGEQGKITIDVKVNEKAAEGKKINKALVTNPEEPDKPQEPTAEVTVKRETKLLVSKIDGSDRTGLKDVEFELRRIDKTPQQKRTITSNAQGEIPLTFTEAGKYELEEITPPAGYKKLHGVIEFEISPKGDMTLKDSLDNMVSLSEGSSGYQFHLIIKNQPQGGLLPETGGFGSGKTFLIGTAFISCSLLLSGYYLLQRRRGWK